MAGSKTDAFETRLLNYLFTGEDLGLSGSLYVALSTAAYAEGATGVSLTEVIGGGYVRAAVPRTTAQWPAATGGQVSNAAPIGFPTATAPWGAVTSFYLCVGPSSGLVLYGGDLGAPKTVAAGDTVTFPVGSLVVTEA